MPDPETPFSPASTTDTSSVTSTTPTSSAPPHDSDDGYYTDASEQSVVVKPDADSAEEDKLNQIDQYAVAGGRGKRDKDEQKKRHSILPITTFNEPSADEQAKLNENLTAQIIKQLEEGAKKYKEVAKKQIWITDFPLKYGKTEAKATPHKPQTTLNTLLTRLADITNILAGQTPGRA